ncbi:beta strand repeat-containing protein [Bacterioplanoides pacificum]|uniref:Beta strand repeat-containing protein n=1 Tax=Bacterioplanoides pacificum TaxID=1171596 RepID=A0ABV7VV66_9GAMM
MELKQLTLAIMAASTLTLAGCGSDSDSANAGQQNGDNGGQSNLDRTPDTFSFSSLTDAEPGSIIESDSVTVTGFDGQLNIAASDGEFQVNGGNWVTSASISAGDTLKARLTAPSDFATSASVTIDINDVSATFSITTRAQDTEPDAFTFTSLSGSELGQNTCSDATTLTGFDGPLSSSISNGWVLLNNAQQPTTGSFNVNPDDKLKVCQQAANAFMTDNITTLTLGTNPGITFTTTTRAADTTPDAPNFAAQTDVEPAQAIHSNEITLTGFDGQLPLRANNGAILIVNDTPLAAGASANVSSGDRVKVRLTSASSFGGQTSTVITLGSAQTTFAITVRDQDSTPDAVTFTSLSDANPGDTQTSNAVTLTGFEGSQPVTVSGGELQINNGGWVSSGSVSSGDSVRLRHTASSDFNTITVTNMTVAGAAFADFSSTTRERDITPDAMVFTSLIDQDTDTVVTSNAVTADGFEGSLTASVSNGEMQVGSGAWTTSATIQPGDTLTLRQTTADDYETAKITSLLVGDESYTFTTTTKVQDTTPDNFTFSALTDVQPDTLQTSNAVTLAGFDGTLTASVSNGEMQIGSGAWTTSGTIQPGDTLTLRQTTANDYETDKTTTLMVNSESYTFTTTTRVQDTTPTPVTFTAQTDVSQGREAISNSVVLTGFDGSATLSVTDGEYQLNGTGSWSNSATNITAGTSIQLRTRAGNGYYQTTDVVLTVNSSTFTFSVTTPAAPDPEISNPNGYNIGGTPILPNELGSQLIAAPQDVAIESSYTLDSAVNGTPINVYNGEYQINYGNWVPGTATSATDIGNYSHTVRTDDIVRVRHTSGSSDRETITSTLMIGGANGASLETRDLTSRTFDKDFYKAAINDSGWSAGQDQLLGMEVPLGYQRAELTEDFPLYSAKATASGTEILKAQLTSNPGSIDMTSVISLPNVDIADLTAIKVADGEDLLIHCDNSTTPAKAVLRLASAATDIVELPLQDATNWSINSCQDVALTDVTRNANSVEFNLAIGGNGVSGTDSGYLITMANLTFDSSISGGLSSKLASNSHNMLTRVDTSNSRTVQAMAALTASQVVYAVAQPNETSYGDSALYRYNSTTDDTRQIIGSYVEPFRRLTGIVWDVADIVVWRKPNADDMLYLVSEDNGMVKVNPDNGNLGDFTQITSGGGQNCTGAVSILSWYNSAYNYNRGRHEATLWCQDNNNLSSLMNMEAP